METSPSFTPPASGEHKTGDGTGPAAPAAPPVGTLRLERMADLVARVGLKKSQLFALIRRGEFPAPIKCGRTSLFESAAVDAWITERIRQSRGAK
jgi:prophage regulatory protein